MLSLFPIIFPLPSQQHNLWLFPHLNKKYKVVDNEAFEAPNENDVTLQFGP